MSMNMVFSKKLTSIGPNEVLSLVGMAASVFGVVGSFAILSPFDSTSAHVFRFSLSFAGIWIGFWLALYRIPATLLTVAWSGLGVALWALKHSN